MHPLKNTPLSYARVPGPCPREFTNGIGHPDLWLWDSWTTQHGGQVQLFCLALSRNTDDGRAILPGDRNDFTFHVRKFISDDEGQTWRDQGCLFDPSERPEPVFSQSVWSGSALARENGRILHGLTGIEAATSDRPFLQVVTVGEQSAVGHELSGMSVISHPVRDYEAICDAGYYLGPKDKLGHKDGEEGGPIMAWRDPFLLEVDGRIQAVWSAKAGPKTGAVARASLEKRDGRWHMVKLHPPIRLPDEAEYTQAEVPKIYPVEGGGYFMLIAACDRIYEGQPDSEVHKWTRGYLADALEGPWRPARADGAILPGMDNLFGGSVIGKVTKDQITILAPYTEQAPADLQLTFAPPRVVNLG